MSARGLWSVVVLALMLFVAGATGPFAASAGELLVDTLGDAGDGSCDPGSCTLRDAIIEANGNPDENTVTFALDGTIFLQDSLVVGHDLTIDATGRDVTISGGFNDRVIRLVAADNIPILEIRSLAIIDGSAASGAGIYNDGGELSVLDSLFSGNDAENGGGIFNLGGVVTVARSTFTDNRSDHGAALFTKGSGGMMTVVDSLVANNDGTGGVGLYQEAGTVTVTNSTFTGNTGVSGVGLLVDEGSLTVVNSTITLNAVVGATDFFAVLLQARGTLTVRNSVVANNQGVNCRGTIVNGGNNIDSGTTCGWGSSDGSLSNTDPKLGPLAENGGPTMTHALLPDSPAIDGVVFINAPNACPAADQRGVPRPQGAACDMGAVEYVNPQPGPNLVVNTVDDEDDGVCETFIPGLADCTLREAIVFANGNPDENTIIFAVDGMITLQESLTVGNDVIIDGTGRDITIDGGGQHRVLNLVAGDNIPVLDIRSLFIVNGAAVNGAGIHNDGGELVVTLVTLEGNVATSGAGIYNAGGAVTVNRTNMRGNSAMSEGGGLYNEGGTALIDASLLIENEASGGAAVYNNGGTVTLRNSTVSGNTGAVGPGLYQFAGSMTVLNSTVTFNNATFQDGGVYNFDGSMVVSNSILDQNGSANCVVVITNGGNNIDSGESCGWGSENGSLSNTDPQLGLLTDNGSSTLTHALLPGSPAIDGVVFNAPNDCPAADQRGVTRPQGSACDSGAFELEQSPPPPPPEVFTLNLPVVVANAGQE